MQTILVHYENGETQLKSVATQVTREDIHSYWIGQTFDLGTDPENEKPTDFVKCVAVETLAEHGRTYGKERELWLHHLTEDMQRKTCGPYEFTVTESATAHTAFLCARALREWLDRLGLIAEESVISDRGTWGKIVGHYRTIMHNCSRRLFETIEGERFRQISNGEYTQAILTIDDRGIRTIHTQNPNCQDRVVYPYRESRAMEA